MQTHVKNVSYTLWSKNKSLGLGLGLWLSYFSPSALPTKDTDFSLADHCPCEASSKARHCRRTGRADLAAVRLACSQGPQQGRHIGPLPQSGLRGPPQGSRNQMFPALGESRFGGFPREPAGHLSPLIIGPRLLLSHPDPTHSDPFEPARRSRTNLYPIMCSSAGLP